MRLKGFWGVTCAAALACAASIPPGDSGRGERLFRDQGCIQCHSINGQGGRTAPDLGKLVDRNFTPSLLASTMWNHAPAMWAAMLKQGVPRPTLGAEGAADLFAYFYSTRFFERPGDAGRGKALFASKHCADCHGLERSNFAGAKPVAQWTSLGHPVALAQAMWNHAANMREAFAQKGVAWPELTGQELSDILVYLRNLPQTRGHSAAFSFEPASGGETVFRAKACAKCHSLQQMWGGGLKDATLTDVAVDMWNHAPRMTAATPTLSEDEMRKIVSYVWALQFFQPQGNAGRGKRVFAAKGCANCHNDASSGAPNLTSLKGSFSDITMITVLWQHGPRMLERMNERKIQWPRFEGGQMKDLIAYLNSQQ